MNKILKYATAALLTAAITAPSAFAANTSFSDINGEKYAWAASEIQKMSKEGYINGYEDGTYKPDNAVTRQECLSLFARIMGCGNDDNKKILEIAHDEFDKTIEPYGLTWGKDEIVYLMYKGVLKETDLNTYLRNDEKSKPMSRYEAAIIITKAMGGDKKANQDKNVQLDYTDALLIPTSALGYVKYASDNDILKGMEDGSFSPKTSVTRAQIAVMLSRVNDKCKYSYKQAKIVSVSTANDYGIKVKLSDGKEDIYIYNDETVMRVLGDEYKPADMMIGVSAVFTFSGEELISVDAISSQPDETVTGRFQGKQNSQGKLYINIIPSGASGTNAQVTYECAPDVSMMFDDSPASINSFTKDDSVEIEISDGKVVSITGTKKETKVSNATVTNVEIMPELTVTISHADEEYDGKTYKVADDVSVRKNTVKSSMDQIYAGDKVTLTLEYDVITKIDATSTTSTKEGTIKSITFADRPNIVVTIGGTDTQFEVTSECAITINDEEAELYDFRVGDKVTITVESDAVKKIRAVSSASTNGSLTGVVTSINSSYGFINVALNDGNGTVQTVFCKDTTTKFLIATTGDEKKMSNIKIGDTVQVNGSVSNGAFVAKVVLITPTDK